MHEYPITLRIIEIAEEYAKNNNANEVKQINLVVGDYCGFDASSIELYFSIIAGEGLCHNAKLNIKRIVPKLKCTNCGQLFIREPFTFECPVCKGEAIPTEIGNEFYIKSILIGKEL